VGTTTRPGGVGNSPDQRQRVGPAPPRAWTLAASPGRRLSGARLPRAPSRAAALLTDRRADGRAIALQGARPARAGKR
jgi:hypothetical protein